MCPFKVHEKVRLSRGKIKSREENDESANN